MSSLADRMMLRGCCASAARASPRVGLLMTDPSHLWSMYELAAESNGLATDVLTNGVIHVVSDSIAQVTERSPLIARAPSGSSSPDIAQVGRFGTFGMADGGVSHFWVRSSETMLEPAVVCRKQNADAVWLDPYTHSFWHLIPWWESPDQSRRR